MNLHNRRHYSILFFLGIVLIILIGILLPTPAYAADPPVGANVTYNYFSEPLIIDSTDIEDLADAVGVFGAIAAVSFEAFLMLAMIAIALWRKSSFLNVCASLVVFFVSFEWFKLSTVIGASAETGMGISMAVGAVGLYLLWTAIIPLFKGK
jgi:hypothetical protein